MPGFRITNIQSETSLYDYRYAKLLNETIESDEWVIKRATLDKFYNDKLFFENESYIVVLEGVPLNSTELICKYSKNSWKDTVCYMIEACGVEWFSQLEGPISGAVLYKSEAQWVVFTGYLGEKAIFYWTDHRRMIVASQLIYIADLMREQGIQREVNEDALCRLAAYNSYIGSETCIRDVRRLYPGEYLIYKNGVFDVHSYGLIDVRQDEGQNIKSEREYIDRLDKAFVHAVNRILAKDREYGYATLVDLSGGYDSRMNAYAVNRLKTKTDSIVSACYGQNGCHDEVVAKRIAKELGYKYVFMSLDDASCLRGVDDNVRMLNGTTHYCGITGGRDILHMLSETCYGLEITGLLGDVHDGSMVTNRSDGDIDPHNYMESSSLALGHDFRFPREENERFENHKNEHFWFYNRGMICGMSSFFIRQNFGEPVTPFGDITFIKEYLSIPWDMRVKDRLLRKWLAQVYPASAEYTNGRTYLKLKSEVGRYGGMKVKASKQVAKICGLLLTNKPRGMNDADYWYKHNELIREYIDSKINEEIPLAGEYAKLEALMGKLKNSESMFDKEAYLTINSILKSFVV